MSEFVQPMLVSEIPGHKEDIMAEDWVYVQPKLDGWCCMANTRTRRIYARSGREITTLPHINASLPAEGPEWLHGELYAHGHSLGAVQSMIKRGDKRIGFHVFDCVSGEAFRFRNDRLLKLKTNQHIWTIPTVKMRPEGISEFYAVCLKTGYEGAIIRLDGHGYEHHRSTQVFKIKPTTEVI